MQKVPDKEEVAMLQASILRYLACRPRASDTVRGIANYWIGTAEVTRSKSPSVVVVQRALDALVATEQIACTTLADGTKVYELIRSNRL